MSKVWTAEATQRLVADYSAAVDANDGQAVDLSGFADQYGVTVASVRSKLVASKVYVKQEVKAVGNASAVRKIHLVRQIEDALGVEVASFEKATKQDLEAVLAALQAK